MSVCVCERERERERESYACVGSGIQKKTIMMIIMIKNTFSKTSLVAGFRIDSVNVT